MRVAGLEPARTLRSTDFKSGVFTNFTTLAGVRGGEQFVVPLTCVLPLNSVIIAYYSGRVGGVASLVIDCFLINARSSGVSSHSQISSCPFLSIFLKVFKAMVSYPEHS